MKLMEALKDGILLAMPEEGILRVRAIGSNKWTEIRGDGHDYTGPDFHMDDFQQAISMLPGPQVSPLYAKDEMFVDKKSHPKAYEYFMNIINNG